MVYFDDEDQRSRVLGQAEIDGESASAWIVALLDVLSDLSPRIRQAKLQDPAWQFLPTSAKVRLLLQEKLDDLADRSTPTQGSQ